VAQHAARAYEPVSQVGKGSLTLWGKHLVADVVTPKNLPWPGWSKLYELPSRSLRQFAHDTYDAEVNLRSLAASTLPVLTTEITIRTHIHGRAILDTGTARLQPTDTALRSELVVHRRRDGGPTGDCAWLVDLWPPFWPGVRVSPGAPHVNRL